MILEIILFENKNYLRKKSNKKIKIKCFQGSKRKEMAKRAAPTWTSSAKKDAEDQLYLFNSLTRQKVTLEYAEKINLWIAARCGLLDHP